MIKVSDDKYYIHYLENTLPIYSKRWMVKENILEFGYLLKIALIKLVIPKNQLIVGR